MIYEFGKGELRVGLFIVDDKPSIVIDRMPPGEVGEVGKPVAEEHRIELGERPHKSSETVLSFEDESTAIAVYDAIFKRNEVAKLRKALEFYADVSKYPWPLTGGMGDLWSDCGAVAREALGDESK